MNIVLASGFLLVLAGCICLYLASPNQRWRKAALPSRAARAASVILLAAGLLMLLQSFQPAAAFFVLITWTMLLLVLLPHLGLLFSTWRRG